MTVELPPTLSYSQLNSFVSCGERYRLERIHRVPSRPSWAQVGGSAIHAVTEARDLTSLGASAYNLTMEFSAAFEAEIAETVERTGFPTEEWYAGGRASKQWPNKEDRLWWEHHGPIACNTWDAWRETTPWDIWWVDDDRPAVELEVVARFGDETVKMVIDRVFVDRRTGEAIIVDIKSGQEPKSSLQLGVYAEGMQQTLGMRPSYGAYWMSRTGSTSTPEVLDRYTTEYLTHSFTSLRKAQRAGIFLPNVGPLCGSCGVREFCVAQGGSKVHEVPAPWETANNLSKGDAA